MKTAVCSALLVTVTLAAMLPASRAQAPASSPDDPTRLPGDRVMPRGMHFPPMPAGTRPPPEPGSDAPGPSLALAIEAAQAAIAACANDGYKVGASVIDSSGQPRVTLAADGATGGHVYTGIRKGLAALAFQEPTSQVSAQADKDKSVEARIAPNMAPMAGAVPLRRGAQVIGAVGVSGASGPQDEKCAAAGVAAISGKLR